MLLSAVDQEENVVFIKKLKGFSGCDISLYIDKQQDRKFVRKVSSCVEYNSRLKKQMEKQINFNDEILKTPKIYGTGFDEGKFYFDMEFIRGVTFHNFISTNSADNIFYIFQKIMKFLSYDNFIENDFTKLVNKKIEVLKLKVDSCFYKYLDYCREYDWKNISSSNSHGDLTFENIIIYNSEIYLIDFLDSFIETKYIDYSKLLQDLILGWSWRNNASSSPFIKRMFLYNKLFENLDKHEIEILKRLFVLSILRIIPYADKGTLGFLKNRLIYIEGKFEI